MAEIIRMGDPTTHGGTVLEGSITDTCMGKPIAYIGHKVVCPLCKGILPIVEGVLTTTFYGQGVAVAGMKTACGASLIATQFTDTVEWSTGAAVRPAVAAREAAPAGSSALAASSAAHSLADTQDSDDDLPFDEQYVLFDEDGEPMADLPYTIKLASGAVKRGTTDAEGKTARYVTEGAEPLEVYIGHIEA